MMAFLETLSEQDDMTQPCGLGVVLFGLDDVRKSSLPQFDEIVESCKFLACQLMFETKSWQP